MNRFVPIVLLAAACSAGCMQSPRLPEAERVVGVDLWAAPLAEDLDGSAGVDGVSIRLMLKDATTPTPVVATETDQIEMLMFEGRPRRPDEREAFHIWRISGAEMRVYLAKFYGLWCYELVLEWPDRMPTANSVTVIARYRGDAGRPIHSVPVTIKIR